MIEPIVARRVVRKLVRAGRRRRRVRLDNDARRAQLLELARRAFIDRTYDDVSVDDIAREAKISKGLLYHYFPTKRELYIAGLREIAEELVARVTAVPDELPPIERARAGLDAYLDHISKHSRAFVSLMRGGIGSDREVVQVIESVRERLFQRFLERSPFEPMLRDDPRFRTAARGWIGFVEGATIDWCADPRISRDDLRDLLAQLVVAIFSVVAPTVVAPTVVDS
jgi:AcrR family transcriptional regulator